MTRQGLLSSSCRTQVCSIFIAPPVWLQPSYLHHTHLLHLDHQRLLQHAGSASAWCSMALAPSGSCWRALRRRASQTGVCWHATAWLQDSTQSRCVLSCHVVLRHVRSCYGLQQAAGGKGVGFSGRVGEQPAPCRTGFVLSLDALGLCERGPQCMSCSVNVFSVC